MDHQSKENTLFEALAFRLGTEEYGIDIQKVQEIRGTTASPASPIRRTSSKASSI
jgi:chemotaxis signal transduction protein